MTNLFDYQTPTSGSEDLYELFSNEKVTINRIVSNQLKNGSWYEQQEDEWLVLLEGEAVLNVNNKIINLKKGDTLFIQAYLLHQVVWTSSKTLWLTIHMPTLANIS